MFYVHTLTSDDNIDGIGFGSSDNIFGVTNVLPVGRVIRVRNSQSILAMTQRLPLKYHTNTCLIVLEI